MRQYADMSHEVQGDILFTATLPDPDHYIGGTVDFDETMPVLAFCRASATDTRRTILKEFSICQVEPVASAVVCVAVVIDPTSRYVSGGEAITPFSNRPGWTSLDAQATVSCRHGSAGGIGGIPEIACSAANVNTRRIKLWTAPASAGNVVYVVPEGEAYIDATGSILIYVWLDEPSTNPVAFKWDAQILERRTRS